MGERRKAKGRMNLYMQTLVDEVDAIEYIATYLRYYLAAKEIEICIYRIKLCGRHTLYGNVREN